MQKKILLLLASLTLAVQLSGCTSKDSKQDSEATSDYDSAELEKLDNQNADAATDNSLVSGQLPEDALGETAAPNETTAQAPESTTDATAAPADTTASTDSSNTDLNVNSNETPAPPTAETPANTAASDIMPPAPDTSSSTTVVDNNMAETSAPAAAASVSDNAPKHVASLQKVASTPWKVGKVWANSIYFARPGDTLTNVSQMIYGDDKTSELKKINPTYKSRDLKPGDKVYYNSPHRPTDSEKMMTYYEDNGQQPEVYVAKKGDNIRKISKELLGYPNAWKEVWASNDVESKSKLDEGTQLRYWKGSAVAAAPAQNEAAPPAQNPEIAQNESAPPPAMPEQAPPPPAPDQHQASADLPPPPPMPQAQEQLPPPPPAPDVAQQQNAAAPPPPPPAEMAPPPPPPPPPVAMEKHKDKAPMDAAGSVGGMDNDTTLALAVVGLAAAGLAVLIVLRKKRKQKELEQALSNDTQVGT